jgi:hypothetical protein
MRSQSRIDPSLTVIKDEGFFFGHFSRRVLGPPRESGRKRAMSDAGTVFIIFVGLAATVTMWCLGLLIANGFVLP